MCSAQQRSENQRATLPALMSSRSDEEISAASHGAVSVLLHGDSASPTRLLNADALMVVFHFFPVRARLLAVSPICKRWRELVLRSVSHLEFDYERHLSKLSTPFQFPSLTSLHLRNCSLAEGLYETLRTPKLLELRQSLMNCCTRLSSLSLSWCGNQVIDTPLDLAVANRLTLTSLSLVNIPEEGDVHLIKFGVAQFPALRELRIDIQGNPPASWIEILIKHHSKHLRSLWVTIVDTQALLPKLATFKWPHLHTLGLSASEHSIEDFDALISAVFPTLRELRLNFSWRLERHYPYGLPREDDWAPLLTRIKSVLVSLTVYGHYGMKAQLCRLLNEFHKLTHCGLFIMDNEEPYDLSVVGPHLKSLGLFLGCSGVKLCTNLTSLQLSLPSSYDAALLDTLPPRLPRLRHLAITCAHSAANCISDLLPRYPSIRVVELPTWYLDADEEAAFLQSLQRHGIERVNVSRNASGSTLWMHVHEAPFTLSVDLL